MANHPLDFTTAGCKHLNAGPAHPPPPIMPKRNQCRALFSYANKHTKCSVRLNSNFIPSRSVPGWKQLSRGSSDSGLSHHLQAENLSFEVPGIETGLFDLPNWCCATEQPTALPSHSGLFSALNEGCTRENWNPEMCYAHRPGHVFSLTLLDAA